MLSLENNLQPQCQVSSDSASISKVFQIEAILDSGASERESSSPAFSSAAQGLRRPLDSFMNFVANGLAAGRSLPRGAESISHNPDHRPNVSFIVCIYCQRCTALSTETLRLMRRSATLFWPGNSPVSLILLSHLYFFLGPLYFDLCLLGAGATG